MKFLFPRRSAWHGALPAACALLLSGCGGGGGAGEPAASTAPTGTSTVTGPATTSASSASGASTALKDNTAATGANFANFAIATVTIPVQDVAYAGARRFVKLSRTDGAVLFIGEVAAGVPFSIKVDAPLGQRRFLYEIFSESAADAIVRGEVIL
jgi:hypothetical protein